MSQDLAPTPTDSVFETVRKLFFPALAATIISFITKMGMQEEVAKKLLESDTGMASRVLKDLLEKFPSIKADVAAQVTGIDLPPEELQNFLGVVAALPSDQQATLVSAVSDTIKFGSNEQIDENSGNEDTLSLAKINLASNGEFLARERYANQWKVHLVPDANGMFFVSNPAISSIFVFGYNGKYDTPMILNRGTVGVAKVELEGKTYYSATLENRGSSLGNDKYTVKYLDGTSEKFSSTISAAGGFVDVGQTVKQAYQTEMLEETGFRDYQMGTQASTQVSMDRAIASSKSSEAKGGWGVTANGLTLKPEDVFLTFKKVKISVNDDQEHTAYVRFSSDGKKKEILITKDFAVKHSRDSYLAVGMMVADTTN